MTSTMDLRDYARCDGVALAKLIANGEVRADEVLDAAYRAVEAVNPRVNAVVELYEPSTLAREIRTDSPFAGVPSLRKDIHSEAGRRTEYGSRVGRGLVARADGEVVARMKDAGVRFIGRSATSELALYTTTETDLFGATRNPWDLRKSVGGSSGGAAAAVAAGAVPFADASDAGGSIRIPAACCGLVGLKPSRTVVVPAVSDADLNENTQLIVARSVRDVLAMTRALEPPWEPREAVPLKVAVSNDPWEPRSSLDPQIAKAVDEVVAIVGERALSVESARPRYDAEDYWDSMLTRLAIEMHRECRALARATAQTLSEDLVEPVTWMYVEEGARRGPGELERALSQRDRVVRAVREFFARYDLLITPTLQVLVPDLGMAGGHSAVASAREHLLMAENVAPGLALFNMTGNPALTVPTGLSRDGLPIGVQLVGRVGDDELLLELASTLEERLPWRQRTPATHVVPGREWPG
ncbi:MAG TPA: amidase [Acidimicrobiales bacterium]|nr:amidase [Acidimicrobiales bacterium]